MWVRPQPRTLVPAQAQTQPPLQRRGQRSGYVRPQGSAPKRQRVVARGNRSVQQISAAASAAVAAAAATAAATAATPPLQGHIMQKLLVGLLSIFPVHAVEQSQRSLKLPFANTQQIAEQVAPCGGGIS